MQHVRKAAGPGTDVRHTQATDRPTAAGTISWVAGRVHGPRGGEHASRRVAGREAGGRGSRGTLPSTHLFRSTTKGLQVQVAGRRRSQRSSCCHRLCVRPPAVLSACPRRRLRRRCCCRALTATCVRASLAVCCCLCLLSAPPASRRRLDLEHRTRSRMKR